jgi:nitroreductase
MKKAAANAIPADTVNADLAQWLFALRPFPRFFSLPLQEAVMVNPTIELINRHGSARSYQPDAVPREQIKLVVEAGQRASTSSNLQAYSVVVTTDSSKKEQLKEISGGQEHIAQAPVFLLWCADFSRLKRVCDHQGYNLEAGYLENFLVAAVDVAIAMQNAALAAESLGLGICYIGSIRNDPRRVRELFDLPLLVYPLAGLTLGYPASAPKIRPRLPLEAVLHWEHYQADDLEYLESYDRAMIATGIYKGRQVGAQDLDQTQYGWMEHTARRVSKPSRPHLRQSIQQAGFALK